MTVRWRNPARQIGDPLVPLDDTYPKAVVFIIGWAQKRRDQRREKPVGTGFIVSMIAPLQAPVLMHSYVVSAAHGLRDERRDTWVRFNKADGGTHDEPVPKWYCHPAGNVAVAPLGRIEADVTSATVPTDAFLDGAPQSLRPRLGDRGTSSACCRNWPQWPRRTSQWSDLARWAGCAREHPREVR